MTDPSHNHIDTGLKLVIGCALGALLIRRMLESPSGADLFLTDLMTATIAKARDSS